MNLNCLKVCWAKFGRQNKENFNQGTQYVHREESSPNGFKEDLFLASLVEKIKKKLDSFKGNLMSQIQELFNTSLKPFLNNNVVQRTLDNMEASLSNDKEVNAFERYVSFYH